MVLSGLTRRAAVSLGQLWPGAQELSRSISSSASALQQAAPQAPPSDQIEVFVNDQPVKIPKNSTVLQACDAAGIDIPRFCYHQRLSIAGNCRMCLVEVEKVPKPVASCAMPAGPGMKIKTDTPMVKKAREGVMEFLLINHPLDCPICDQGGECDLQDQAMIFGSDRSRFVETKRAVEDKNLGPLVKTVMNRCIHCTRCVRFASEVAGTAELGVTGRGRDSEIGTYVEKLMVSELSGNVVDLCPVGALTSKPYAFTARSWELKATESIDVSDALGANIRVDSRGTEVMRILPRLNEEINEEWLSDKGRYQYDGLKRQRLDKPMVKGPKGLQPATWVEALGVVAAALSSTPATHIKAVAGKLADAESMVALMDLMRRLGVGNLVHEGGFADMPSDVRSTYTANTTVAGIEQADMILLVGTNPRWESPVFNARIRKTFLDGAQVGLLGAPVDLTYKYEHVGSDPAALAALAAGQHPFLERLKKAVRPAVIVGPGVLRRPDREAVMKAVHDLCSKAGVVKDNWNGFNVIHDTASRVAALDMGFAPSVTARAAKVQPKVVYLLGADDWEEAEVPAGAFVIYQGHHGDRGAARADVILPGAAYTEKSGLYVNFEGRVQQTRPAVPLLGEAREDWAIVRALSEVLGKRLPYDDVAGVRARLADVAPHFANINSVQTPVWLNGEYVKGVEQLAKATPAQVNVPLGSTIENYYMTDAISRASRTMAKCVLARQEAQSKAAAAAVM
ncbi:NADH:ubiquinone oxidoreductase 76 kDa subunit [Volvox carteri f. nagariensis]|uniref:NADH:ubiquinone oxidoreductase 76 kDa subunit n=1 Tax=Volvox carteri f. nagariensis TaxID=3068 RepID=D8U3X4_VOLCA|nr:NADH:ubiquinone oxidoreductase 76 kDa subunit [Volvox carteri f. nagariensis]EFJ45606.1 NADH:ubiquinone oxidoreductase 76 kDa subunit [Volvox carteri f. nagariensis]|eukprot:XP_002953296.1 NADH:ubiquinone oxidoreductase 76 kDa subunit [Volvox carteri f. nagariensis]